jgi:hypothetical protein
VGRWAKIFKLLSGEDVDSDKMDLGVTVLSSLGGRHIDNLAWTTLNNDVTVLPQGRALHGVGSRSSGIGGIESVFMLQRRFTISIRSCDGNFRRQSEFWG